MTRLRRACRSPESTESARRLCRTTKYDPAASAAADAPTASVNAIVRRRRRPPGETARRRISLLAGVESIADPTHRLDQLRLFRGVLGRRTHRPGVPPPARAGRAAAA